MFPVARRALLAGWRLGSLVCKLAPALQCSTVGAMVYTLAFIALDRCVHCCTGQSSTILYSRVHFATNGYEWAARRCLAICHSLRSQKMSRRALAGLVGGIWAASALVAAPNLLLYEYCPLLASNGPAPPADMSADERLLRDRLLGLRTCQPREHLLLLGVSFRAYFLFVLVFNYVVRVALLCSAVDPMRCDPTRPHTLLLSSLLILLLRLCLRNC